MDPARRQRTCTRPEYCHSDIAILANHERQVINAGDALDFLCGGFYKPTIHRVIQPPADQRNCPRLGVFYFSMPNDSTRLVPYAETSPVLKRVGVRRLCEDKDAPTMLEWRKGRTVSYGRAQLKAGKEKDVEEEEIKGVIVKHYN